MTLKALCTKYKIKSKDIVKAGIMQERNWIYLRQDNSKILRTSLETIEKIHQYLYNNFGEQANEDFSKIIEIQLKNRFIGEE